MIWTVLLDFSPAFDVIDHDIMITILKSHIFSVMALSWMVSYLSEGSQYVFYNGRLSDCRYVRSAKMVMYADDTTLYSSASTN